MQSYEIYENAREIENKSEKVQVATFLNTIGEAGVEIFNSFNNIKIRICSDMTRLNKAVKREIHPMATVEGSLAQVKGNVFSKLDANSGFWQIPLHETSWNLTTFLTPWGRSIIKSYRLV